VNTQPGGHAPGEHAARLPVVPGELTWTAT